MEKLVILNDKISLKLDSNSSLLLEYGRNYLNGLQTKKVTKIPFNTAVYHLL